LRSDLKRERNVMFAKSHSHLKWFAKDSNEAGPVATLWSWTSGPIPAQNVHAKTHSVLAAARGYPSPFLALFNDGELLDLIALGLIGASSTRSGSSGGISESCSNIQPSPRIFFHFS
jgi:hypothetical protein